jgi:hypothetical protein
MFLLSYLWIDMSLKRKTDVLFLSFFIYFSKKECNVLFNINEEGFDPYFEYKISLDKCDLSLSKQRL